MTREQMIWAMRLGLEGLIETMADARSGDDGGAEHALEQIQEDTGEEYDVLWSDMRLLLRKLKKGQLVSLRYDRLSDAEVTNDA